MLNFQDLPDEIVLKILRYSETKDLISCGQVSKRIRQISRDGTLWVTANLEKKIVKTELLEMILGKGCRNLNLQHSTILGHLSSNIKSQLSVFYFSRPVCKCDEDGCDCDKNTPQNTGILEELLSSCCLLQHLVLENILLTSKMADSICKNGKTLQTLHLKRSYLEGLTYDNLDGTLFNKRFQEIIKCCQELKEVDLAYLDDARGLTVNDLQFLAENISTNVEKLNLSTIWDDHSKILHSRCNKITISAHNVQLNFM